MKPLPCADRIISALRLQPMTIVQLAIVLCEKRNTVDQTVRRIARDNWITPAGFCRGLGKPAMLWRVG